MKYQKLIYFITGIIISIQTKASNQQIAYNPSYNTKTIARIFIKSKCFWGNLPEHDSLQCGNCKQVNDGEIVETYQFWNTHELSITRKPLFEPTLFLTSLLSGILQETRPKNSNPNTLKKNQEIWNSNKQKVITSLETILTNIQQYIIKNNCDHKISDLPEFYSMNTCSILWKEKTDRDVNPISRIGGSCDLIKVNNKVVIPQSEFKIDLFEIDNTKDNALLPSNDKGGAKKIVILLNLISIISSSRKKSILHYNPNVQEAILLNALQKIKSINPCLNTQCN